MAPAIVSIIAIAGLLFSAWWWWRRNLAPPTALSEPERSVGASTGSAHPDPTCAIVLVHGILGWSSFGFGRARVDYFRRVARRLEARGAEVIVVRLPALGGVPARGQALLAQLDGLPHERLVIVAHSLGGLDARWALARGGLAARVHALVTIGTPHRGTPIADALARGPAVWLRRALARLGLPSDAVDWLTTERLATFNREIGDAAGVTYGCVVAATDDARRVHPLLRVTHGFLAAHGPSDGLVPAASQAWGAVLGEADCDHWAQIGWSVGGPGRHDAAALVERALDQLRALPPGPAPRLLSAGDPHSARP
jgi:triacylglycerol lipase